MYPYAENGLMEAVNYGANERRELREEIERLKKQVKDLAAPSRVTPKKFVYEFILYPYHKVEILADSDEEAWALALKTTGYEDSLDKTKNYPTAAETGEPWWSSVYKRSNSNTEWRQVNVSGR